MRFRTRGSIGRTRRRVVIALGAVALLTSTLFILQRQSPPPILNAEGSLPTAGTASCHEVYSLDSVGRRAFAFDGTVVGIGRAISGGQYPAASGVTFKVNEWFKGGGSGQDRVVVDLAKAARLVDTQGEERLSYGVGTRLLVSGEPRWGGKPLDKPFAFGCGFTRYFLESEAGEWRAVFAPS